MNIFGVGMAILGGAFVLVVDAVTASGDGKRRGKRSRSSPENTEEQNSNPDS